MKKISLSIVASLALGLVTPLFFAAGCAATSTRESTGEFVDDATITTKVKAEMVRDHTVKAADVKVETFKGVVQLSGFVDSATEKDRAGQIAASTRGVTGVQNNITIK